MDFLGGVWKNVQNFFGGGNNKKKKREEESRATTRRSSYTSNTQRSSSNAFETPQEFNQQQNQQSQKPKPKRPENVFEDINRALRLPGSMEVKTQPLVAKSAKEQELDALTEQKMAREVKNVERGQDVFTRGLNTITGNNQRTARQNARNQATNEYQEKNGWNRDEEVMEYVGNTRNLSKDTSQRIKTQGNVINRLEKGLYDAAGAAQYVPVAGSVLNLGLAGAEAFGGEKERARASEVRKKIDFGMTDAEFNALDSETKRKLGIVQNVGLAAAPLDFLGLGGLVKSGVGGLAKNALVSTAKRESLDAATRAGIKTLGKNSLKVAAPAAILGTGVSAGLQGYLSGEVDPLEALKTGAMTAGTSMLLPSQSVREAGQTAARGVDIPTPMPALTPAPKPTPIKIDVKQPRQIDLIETSDEAFDVPVKNQPAPRQPIVEVSGDTPGQNQVQVPTAQERASQQFAAQPAARPDSRVEGLVPGKLEDTTIYTRQEVDGERAALDEALANKEINKTQYKLANKELDSLPVADPTKGAKIEVKQVNDIPVAEETMVPVDVPEVPGTVRVTTSADPVAAKSQQVAAQQPVALPAEVQNVLDNPKQFNKRQVASARNQRKLANQMAKTQEQTADALARIESASPAAQSGQGFVPTGEFGKSVNGGAYQKVSRQTEMQRAVEETSNLSPGDVVRTARETASKNGGGFNRRDIRNIAALFETKRLQRGTPEWNEARQILKEDGTNWGQTGALRNYTMRKNASSDELISRFESKIYRLADDPSKIDSRLFDEVDAAETNFVQARDSAMQAYNRFTESPTPQNSKAYHAAQDAAEKADANAKQVEFKVAKAALKGNKDVQQVRELEKMAQSADMYQMDAVDSSMLSSTGTFTRNFVNASVGGVEEAVFGKIGAKVASLTPKSRKEGVSVGGGIGRGSLVGLKKGAENVVDVSKARAGMAGKNPLEHIKNWATTGNQLGDAVIDAQAHRGTLDHYTQSLKSQGYKGRELKDRASVMARQDPDDVQRVYTGAARTAAGLGDGANVASRSKIEASVANLVSDMISAGKPNTASDTVAKVFTRMTIGFPTAIGRSTVEGGKRFLAGTPTLYKAMRTTDPHERAVLIKEAVKQAGTGAIVLPTLFQSLGAAGVITGGYPSDKSERERWKREGITENSIKVGDDYYQLPAYLGAWAVPALFYAGMGRNDGDIGASLEEMKTVIPALLPTDQMSNVMDAINGKVDFGKFMTQMGASAARAATPAGALLNQIGKMMDSTQNDTNSGSNWENLISKVINGIPGLNLTLESKTDSEGNALANPDALALSLGAASTSQKAGVEQTNEINDATNSRVQSMKDVGALDDPNLKDVITDEDTKKIYNNIKSGKQATPDEIEKLQKAMVKGVEASGTDTAYLEREQYDTNLTVLNMKRDLMASDPTVKPSSLEKVDLAIKRGEVYKNAAIPYDLIEGYQDTTLTEWRDMADPESDDYDPDRYQQLWDIDEMMTKAGVSYKKGALDKAKFYAKESKARSGGKGRGGSGGGGSKGNSINYGADFGTLKPGVGAPSVQQYETLDQRSGGVPVIQTKRPNIVHKIGYSG